MVNSLRTLGAALALAGALASCGSADHAAETATAPAPTTTNPADSLAVLAGDSARMGKATGIQVAGATLATSKTVAQNLGQPQTLSTLAKLVHIAGLTERLAGEGPFTIFAPTNAAFDKLPSAAVAELSAPANVEKLKGLLTYHVIPGRLVAADLHDGQQLSTLNGEKLHISVRDGKVLIGNGKDAPATLQTADAISSNGVVHLIDTVVLPLPE